jgi:hypothetical protein
MTEAEWLACDRPHWMLNELRPWKRRGRKMWLYVCASYRRPVVWNRLKEPCLILLDVAERHADGLVGQQEYRAAMQAVSQMTKRDKVAGSEDGPPLYGQALLDSLRLKHLPGWEDISPQVERYDYLSDEARRDRAAMRSRGMEVITEEEAIDVQKEFDGFMKDHTNFVRDIFGNPFRPAAINPAWLTPTVLAQAQAIYDDRILPAGTLDNTRLGILGDALEEAGCTDADILAHCRQAGEHVRGCWVVDLVLGKD